MENIYSSDLTNWLLEMRAAFVTVQSNPEKFRLQITEVGDNSIFGIFEVSSVVDNTTYFNIQISTVIAQNGEFNQDAIYTISWVSDGANGAAGTSGTSGTRGTSGTTGANGTSGTTGTNGTSGTRGTSGTSGTTGAAGTSGSSGTTGATGTSGTNGAAGNDGALTGRWNFTTGSTSPSNPGSASFNTNTTILSSVNKISISINDINSANWFNILNSFDVLVGNSQTLLLQITEVGNSSVYAAWEILDLTNNTTYFDIPSMNLAFSSGNLTNGRTYTLSWVLYGRNGTSGTSGATGTSGTTGATGTSGTTGATGTSGTRGTSGTSGLLLLSGNTDNGLITLSGSAPNATVESNLTFNGSTLAVTGTLSVAGRYQFTHQTITELSANGGYGDIVTFGSGTVATFSTYYFSSASSWLATDADTSTVTGLIGISLGGNVSSGILLRGYVRNSSWSWATASALYLSTTASAMTQTAPTATGDYIRIVGYAISTNTIYFCPDNTWIQI